MANQMSIGIGVKLADIATTQKNLQTELNKIAKTLSLNIETIKIEDLNKSTEQIKQQINKLNDSVKITPTVDNNIAIQSLNEYVSLVKNKIKEIEGQTTKISNIKISTDNKGNILGANATLEIDNADKKVLKFNQDLQLLNKTFTDNDAKEKAMFNRQNEYLDKAISKLNQYKQAIKEHGSGISQTQITSEIDTQINKLNELRESNTLLGNAEKTRINESINGLKDETSALTQHQHSLSDMLKMMVGYAGVGAIVYGGINQLKQGINDIIDIDTAMRDLTKVAKATQDQLNKFPEIANSIGISIGASTNSIISSTEYYSKLGYAIDEASKRAEKATIFSNVADMDIDDASKALITIQKGFNLNTLEDMNRIMDVANEIGNNYSSTSKDVAEGLRRMGNAMKEAGNSYEQSVGIFVAGNASVQDAEVVGNAIKTISMRLRGMKTEIDETGIPASKLRQAIKDITASAGQEVDIMKNDNTFKSTYEQMTQLAEVYPKLTDAQRSYLQYVIAGQRQGNIFSGLMMNMKDGIDAYNTALNSSGSAMREQEKYMNSIEGRLNAFKETVKSVWVESISSSSIKNLVSGATSAVSELNNIIKTFGAMPTVIMGAIGAMTMFNSQFRQAMSYYQPSFITNWNKAFTGLKVTLGEVATQTRTNIIATRNSINAMDAQGVSTLGAKAKLAGYQVQLGLVTTAEKACALGAEALGMAFNMALGLGIGLAIQAVTSFITSAETLKAENEQLLSSIKTLSNDITGIEELKNKFSSLSEEIQKGGLSAEDTKAKKQQLSDVYDQLIQKSPELKNLIDLESGSYKDQIDAIQGVIDKKNEEAGLKAEQYLRDNKVTDSGVLDQIKEMQRMQEELAVVEKNLERTDLTESQRKNTQDYITNLKTDISEIKTSLSETLSVQDTLNRLNINNGINSNTVNSVKQAVDSVKLYNSAIDQNTTKTNENTIAKDKNNNVSTDTDRQAQIEQEKANAIAEATDEYSKSTQEISKMEGYIDRLNKSQGMTTTLAKQISTAYPEIGDSINSVASAQEFLTSKIEEQVAIQQSTIEIMKGDDEEFYQEKIVHNEEFQTAYNNLLNAFVSDGEGAYSVDFSNFSTLNQLKQATQGDLGIAVENWLRQFVGSSADGYAQDFANFQSFAQAKANILDKLNAKIQSLSSSLQSAQAYASQGLTGSGQNLSLEHMSIEQAQAYEAEIAKLGSAKKEIDSLFNDAKIDTSGYVGGGVGGFAPSGGGKSAESEAKKAQQELIKSEKETISKITEAYDDAKAKIEDTLSDIDYNIEMLGDETNDNFPKRIEYTTQKLEQQREEVNRATEQLMGLESTTVTTEEAQKALADATQKASKELRSQKLEVVKLTQELQKQLKEQEKLVLEQEKSIAETTLEAKQADQLKQLEDYTSTFEKSHEDIMNAYDEQLKALEDQNEEEERANELQEQRNDLKQKEIDLERLKNQKTIQTFAKDANGNWNFSYTYDTLAVEAKQKEVDEAQKTLDDTIRQQELEDAKAVIEAQKTAEEELYKKKKEYLDKYSDDLKEQQDLEKQRFDEYYSDMDKLAFDRLQELSQQYGDNWDTIATTIQTKLTETQDTFKAMTTVKLNFGLDGLQEALNSSDLNGYLIQKRDEINKNVQLDLNGLSQELDNINKSSQELSKTYDDILAVKDKNEITYEDVLARKNQVNSIVTMDSEGLETQLKNLQDINLKLENEKDSHYNKELERQNKAQQDELDSFKKFAEEYLLATNKFTELLQVLWDFRFSNIVNIVDNAGVIISQALQAWSEAYVKFAQIYNSMVDEDHQIANKIEIDDALSSILGTHTTVVQWEADKSKLYTPESFEQYYKQIGDGIGESLLSKLSNYSSSGYVSSSNIISNTTNTSNSSSSTTKVIINDVVVQANSESELIEKLITIAEQKTNVL